MGLGYKNASFENFYKKVRWNGAFWCILLLVITTYMFLNSFQYGGAALHGEEIPCLSACMQLLCSGFRWWKKRVGNQLMHQVEDTGLVPTCYLQFPALAATVSHKIGLSEEDRSILYRVVWCQSYTRRSDQPFTSHARARIVLEVDKPTRWDADIEGSTHR